MTPCFGPVPRTGDDFRAYCGPSAIAVLTGEPVEHIESFIQKTLKYPAHIREMLAYDINKVIRLKGFRLERASSFAFTTGLVTLGRWLKQTKEARSRQSDVYLVYTRQHVSLISGDDAVDNYNGGKPVPVAFMKKRRSYLAVAYVVSE
jgi:hypothetical protein